MGQSVSLLWQRGQVERSSSPQGITVGNEGESNKKAHMSPNKK